jgi:hypothetical protein
MTRELVAEAANGTLINRLTPGALKRIAADKCAHTRLWPCWIINLQGRKTFGRCVLFAKVHYFQKIVKNQICIKSLFKKNLYFRSCENLQKDNSPWVIFTECTERHG